MSDQPKVTGAKPKRAPTLYLIVALKIIKGSLLLLAALGISLLAGRDLGDTFDQFLISVHLDPERQFFMDIGDRLALITPANLRVFELGTFLYGLLLLGGGLGLAFRAHWAVWLAIGESAFFIPIEIYELLHRHRLVDAGIPTHHGVFHHGKLALFVVLMINVVIVTYLSKNRNRIFRNH